MASQALGRYTCGISCFGFPCGMDVAVVSDKLVPTLTL